METTEVFGYEMDAEEIRDRIDALVRWMPDGDAARNWSGWDELNELEAALAELEGEQA